MTPEVGKTYKTRGGDQAVVSGDWGKSPDGSDSHYPLVGWVRMGHEWMAKSWTSTGMCIGNSSPCGSDLVAEWREPRTLTFEMYMHEWSDGSVSYGTIPMDGKVVARRTITLTEGEGV